MTFAAEVERVWPGRAPHFEVLEHATLPSILYRAPLGLAPYTAVLFRRR